jgi:3-oxoacyl-[acyl-carrier protein] reductase
MSEHIIRTHSSEAEVGRLSGKVALVTGSGRGIGRAIAGKLAREGARVVLNDLEPVVVAEAVNALRAEGHEAIGCPGSVTDDGFADRFIGEALKAWNDIHIIVNNAGYTWDNVIQKMSDEQFDAILNVHVRAPFRILRAAAEPIRVRAKKEQAEGRPVVRKVVNISSVAAGGNPGQANYGTAKAGVIGLTKVLAREWGRYQVAVNCVAFGYIRTRLTEPLNAQRGAIEIDGRKIPVGVSSTFLETAQQVIPLGRGGTPDDAAGAVFLFCIPESDYVSGQVLICGGGFGSI